MSESVRRGSRPLRTREPRCITRKAAEAIFQMKRGDPTLFAWEIRDYLHRNGFWDCHNQVSLDTVRRIIRNYCPTLPKKAQVTSQQPVTKLTTKQSASRCSEGSSDSWYRSFTWDSPQPPTANDQEESSQRPVNEPTTKQSASRCSEGSSDSWYRSFTWDSPQPSTAKEQEETRNENSANCKDDLTSCSSQEQRRSRTLFSPQQIASLEKEYERSNYLDSNERRKVADLVGLGEDRVQTWFSNRRRKSRREGGFCQPKKSCSSLMHALFIAASSNEPKTGSMIVPTASVPPQSVVLSSGHPHIIPYPIVSPLPYRLPLAEHCEHIPLAQLACSRPSVSFTADEQKSSHCMNSYA